MQEEWAAKLERCESSWATKYEALRADSERDAEERRREWTRKYYVTEGEWFKKLQAANQDWGEAGNVSCGRGLFYLRGEGGGGGALTSSVSVADSLAGSTKAVRPVPVKGAPWRVSPFPLEYMHTLPA